MDKTTKRIPAKSVDEYLNALPPKVRNTLGKVRKAVKSAAPMAEEGISYHVPFYKYKGAVACFAAYKDHCSFFATSHSIMQAFKNELKEYDTSGVTIRFPLDRPLPSALIKKLVLAKILENEARLWAKEKMKTAK